MTLGDMLIEARKKAGLSAHDISQRTHIMLSAIHNLEDDKQSSLPAAGYVRGYILSYCKICETDPQPFLEQFERQSGSSRRDAISKQDYDVGGNLPSRRTEQEMNWKVIIIIVAAIVLIAGGFFLFGRGGGESASGVNPLPLEANVQLNTDPDDQVAPEDRVPFDFVVEAREGRASDVLITVDGNTFFDANLTDVNPQEFEGALKARIEIANPENVVVLQNGTNIPIPEDGIVPLTASER